MSEALAWLNGRLRPLAEVACSPLTHALHYGSGVFEGIRAYGTSEGPLIFRLDDHLERMRKGAACLGIDLDVPSLREGCLQVLAESGLQDAYLRPLAYRALGGLSMDVDALSTETLVLALPWSSHLTDAMARGVDACVSSYRRNSSEALPPLKLCGGYVNALLAKREARAKGVEEAVFVDAEGYVVEATGENIFLVKHGRVIGVDHPDALAGITRDTVVHLCGAELRRVTLTELLDADEVFFTGTSAEVAPVGRLDDRTWAPGPVTRDVRRQYLDLVRGRTTARPGWTTPVASVLDVVYW